MASISELKDALAETLENRGVMGQLKARIRAEIFSALDDPHEIKPTLSNENMIINELIREYLEYNGYKYTLSVLMAETGQPKEQLNREFVASELNIVEDAASKEVPLMYSMFSHFVRHGPHGASSAGPGAGPLGAAATSRAQAGVGRSQQQQQHDARRDSVNRSDSEEADRVPPVVVHGGRR